MGDRPARRGHGRYGAGAPESGLLAPRTGVSATPIAGDGHLLRTQVQKQPAGGLGRRCDTHEFDFAPCHLFRRLGDVLHQRLVDSGPTGGNPHGYGFDSIHLRNHRCSQGGTAASPRGNQQWPVHRHKPLFAAGWRLPEPLPLFHAAGCVVAVLGALTNSATLILPEVFEPGLVLDMCERERSTVMGRVPTVLITMMEHPEFSMRNLGSLKTIGGGGASVPTTLVGNIEQTLGIETSGSDATISVLLSVT
ncbi:MAG: AMP-binding protein [Pseudomonadales bacterium]|nr:AMP-binding protein [Pseudomonadales bacterium]MDP6470299.1 AMP-binding protein [Pseudomonadales bacterium]MDP6827205.1 AMP-binding protein [Pseudomonadales bacterium]MDP6972493.1 AMP-binding protein [Pseudomonadales bacterium]